MRLATLAILAGILFSGPAEDQSGGRAAPPPSYEVQYVDTCEERVSGGWRGRHYVLVQLTAKQSDDKMQQRIAASVIPVARRHRRPPTRDIRYVLVSFYKGVDELMQHKPFAVWRWDPKGHTIADAFEKVCCRTQDRWEPDSYGCERVISPK